MEGNDDRIEDKVKVILDEYLLRYEPETPNDELLLSQMARIEVQIKMVDLAIEEMLSGVVKHKHTEQEAMFRNKQRLVAQHQSIQTSLGISRKDRESEEDVKKELPRIISAAQEFLEENTTFVYCPFCKAEPAEVKIRLGYLFHFRQDVPYYWCNQCPRCGGLVEIYDNWPNGKPTVALPDVVVDSDD